MSISPGRLRQRGMTIVELVMFIVIVGIALAGIVQVFSLGTRFSADPLRRKQAIAIAESLLEEVEQARFTYCDPSDANAETARSAADCATTPEVVGREDPAQARPYDNVNDYVTAYSSAQHAFDNGAGVLTDASGTAIPVSGYSATVSIVQEGFGGIATAADVLRISVTVNYDGDSITLEGYRTRYAPNSVP
jgi:MSHA pilin protein MshD